MAKVTLSQHTEIKVLSIMSTVVSPMTRLALDE